MNTEILCVCVKLDCIVFHWIKKAPKQTSHDSVKVTRFHKIFFLGTSKSLAPLNMFLGLKEGPLLGGSS